MKKKGKKWDAALEKYWAENPSALLDAMAKNPDAFNISPSTDWMQGMGSEIAEVMGPHNALLTGNQNTLERYATDLSRMTTLEQIRNTGLPTINSLFSLGGDSQKESGYASIIDHANSLGISLVEHRGGDRYKIQDVGAQDTDAYVNALAGAGLLPESLSHYERHRTFDDGSFSISYDEPDQNFASTVFPLAVKGAIGSFAGAAVPGLGLTGTTAGAAKGATTAGVGSLLDGGKLDLEEIAKGALTGGALTGLTSDTVLDNLGGFGDVYRDPNMVGAAVRGVTNDAIVQLVQDGKLDVEGLATAGLTNIGLETLQDLYKDARSTNDGNLEVGIDTVDGSVIINPAEVERLTNTSDLYATLGEGGMLDKLGISPESLSRFGLFTEDGYLKTDYIGDALDFIGLGGRFDGSDEVIAQFQEDRAAATEQFETEMADLKGKYEAGDLTFEEYYEQFNEANSFFKATLEADTAEYYQQAKPYDEREFIFGAERGDSPMTGIYEFDGILPGTINTTLAGIDLEMPDSNGKTMGEVVQNLPEPERVAVVGDTTVATDEEYIESPLPAEDEFEDLETTGFESDFEGDLPSAGDSGGELTTGAGAALPPGGDGSTLPPGSGMDYNLPGEDSGYIPDLTSTEPDEPSSTSGSTPTGGDSAFEGTGMFASEDDWQDYMSGLNVAFPVLDRLQITKSQYLDQLSARMKGQ